jgi:lysophospholipase L1-like esterase
MRIYVIGILIVSSAIFSSSSILGQLVDDFQQPARKADCCLGGAAQQLADALTDWNELGHYREDNQRLQAQPTQPDRVIFLGDSITANWDLTRYFPGKHYVNRGIGGQTTPQMLVRMFPDVIDLHPAAVVILAGTNDIAGNTGPMTAKMVEENLQAMTELAQKHGIRVTLCSVPPVHDYSPSKRTARRPLADIVRLNSWIKQYVDEARVGFADYYSALVDAQGMLKEECSGDGIHPNAKGYGIMASVMQAALKRAPK